MERGGGGRGVGGAVEESDGLGRGAEGEVVGG